MNSHLPPYYGTSGYDPYYNPWSDPNLYNYHTGPSGWQIFLIVVVTLVVAALVFVIIDAIVDDITYNKQLKADALESERKEMNIVKDLAASGIVLQKGDAVNADDEKLSLLDSDLSEIELDLDKVDGRWGVFAEFPDGSYMRLSAEQINRLRELHRAMISEFLAELKAAPAS